MSHHLKWFQWYEKFRKRMNQMMSNNTYIREYVLSNRTFQEESWWKTSSVFVLIWELHKIIQNVEIVFIFYILYQNFKTNSFLCVCEELISIQIWISADKSAVTRLKIPQQICKNKSGSTAYSVTMNSSIWTVWFNKFLFMLKCWHNLMHFTRLVTNL